ncbi:hypothetical protein Tco_0890302 [Tanacetum coccineum]|uniref:Uncharacterized protein n=1 Tax=Tanacetum coccineum TaxID=301880 RepID=A0ABQ5BZN1_9ASTR
MGRSRSPTGTSSKEWREDWERLTKVGWISYHSASKAEFQGKMGLTWEGPYIVKKAYGDRAHKLETLSSSLIDRT